MLAKGQVIDSKSKEVLPQATIIVTDKDGNLIRYTTKPLSKSQRYKMLGNGFTVDVIAHILKGVDA